MGGVIKVYGLLGAVNHLAAIVDKCARTRSHVGQHRAVGIEDAEIYLLAVLLGHGIGCQAEVDFQLVNPPRFVATAVALLAFGRKRVHSNVLSPQGGGNRDFLVQFAVLHGVVGHRVSKQLSVAFQPGHSFGQLLIAGRDDAQFFLQLRDFGVLLIQD